jgi:hypothetical protein
MFKPKQVSSPPAEYATKFRQNQPDRGVAGSRGADVPPPVVTRHIIGATGKPEASILPGFGVKK